MGDIFPGVLLIVRENEITVPAMRFREGLIRSAACGMTGLKVYHTVLQTRQRQFNFVTNHVMAGKGMNDPHQVLKSLSISRRGPVISTLSNPQHGPGKDVSALPWHQYVTGIFFTVLQ